MVITLTIPGDGRVIMRPMLEITGACTTPQQHAAIFEAVRIFIAATQPQPQVPTPPTEG